MQNGDRIRLSVARREIALLVDDAELARRMAAAPVTRPTAERGYRKLFMQTVTQADQGVDFDFLRAGATRYRACRSGRPAPTRCTRLDHSPNVTARTPSPTADHERHLPDDHAEPAADALADALAELEEDIVFGRLHPRQRLTEDELMERFGLARHAVRQILAELEALGAVEKSAISARWCAPLRARGHGAVRAAASAGGACRQPDPAACAAGAAGGAGGRAANTMRRSPTATRRVFRSNQRFHRELFGLLDNTVLGQAIEEYARRTHPIRFARWHRPAIANARARSTGP